MKGKPNDPSSNLVPAESLVRRNEIARRPLPDRNSAEVLGGDGADHLDVPEGPGRQPGLLPREPYERPEVWKAVALGGTGSRRRFIVASLAGGAAVAAGCKKATIDIVAEGGECTCHVVCTCDTVGSGSNQEAVFENGKCTCNTVCTCDTQSGGGGGGTTYWY